MEKNLQISYSLTSEDGNDYAGHEEDIENDSEKHIFEMVQEGFTSGELQIMDNEDMLEYHGWWEMKEINPTQAKNNLTVDDLVIFERLLLQNRDNAKLQEITNLGYTNSIELLQKLGKILDR